MAPISMTSSDLECRAVFVKFHKGVEVLATEVDDRANAPPLRFLIAAGGVRNFRGGSTSPTPRQIQPCLNVIVAVLNLSNSDSSMNMTCINYVVCKHEWQVCVVFNRNCFPKITDYRRLRP